MLAKTKPCVQEGFCSAWADCPYSHDMKKCREQGSAEMEPEDARGLDSGEEDS